MSIKTFNTEVVSPFLYNIVTIPGSAVVKNLGLPIDSTLDWRAQVSYVSQKVTLYLRAPYRLKNFISVKIQDTLMQSLTIPLIDYSDACYFDLKADLLNKLDRLLNN